MAGQSSTCSENASCSRPNKNEPTQPAKSRNLCQIPNLTSFRQGGFYRPSQHFLGCGVVLSSSSRVKKGPGRRPQSAKRRWFVELRERGWSVRAAAREVGVSRTTGANWSRGYKTYRRGEVVGFVPPLERLAVRQISPRFLSQDERIEIADLRRLGVSIRQIASRLGRAPSTISRELRRNGAGRGLPSL
jgi:lambda repressor-like predicted transcriptional regulator